MRGAGGSGATAVGAVGRVLLASSNATSASNATTGAAGSAGEGMWTESVAEATSMTIPESLVTGLVFWSLFMVLAIGLAVIACCYFRPPQRTWPDKAPACGCLPWPCLGRMLGYGFIGWHTGMPVSLRDFILERHELVGILTGDPVMVSPYLRSLACLTNTMAQLSMSIAFTNPDGGLSIDSEGDLGEWAPFIVLGFTLSGNIVMGMAMRLISIAAEYHGGAWKHKFSVLAAGLCALFLVAAIITVEVKRVLYIGGTWYIVYFKYITLFMQSISFGWVFAQPMAMIVVWTLGDFLFRISKNHYGFEKLEINVEMRRKAQLGRLRVLKGQLDSLKHDVEDGKEGDRLLEHDLENAALDESVDPDKVTDEQILDLERQLSGELRNEMWSTVRGMGAVGLLGRLPKGAATAHDPLTSAAVLKAARKEKLQRQVTIHDSDEDLEDARAFAMRNMLSGIHVNIDSDASTVVETSDSSSDSDSASGSGSGLHSVPGSARAPSKVPRSPSLSSSSSHSDSDLDSDSGSSSSTGSDASEGMRARGASRLDSATAPPPAPQPMVRRV